MFLTSNIRQAFIKLRQAFIKVQILNYLDLKYYIYIKIEVFGYVIDKILSQLTLDDLDQ